MDEVRKRVLWICATILAGPKLTELEDGKNDSAQAQITQDAILKAERIMRQIHLRWPADRVPGKN
jgi:hypothetical protein